MQIQVGLSSGFKWWGVKMSSEFAKVFRDKRGGQHYREFSFAGVHYRLTGRFGYIKTTTKSDISAKYQVVAEAESFDGKITWSTEEGDFYNKDRVSCIWNQPFPNPGKLGLKQGV